MDLEKPNTHPESKVQRQIPPTATVAKAPNNNDQEVDFFDFIPIDSNAEDFDLTYILQNIDQNDQNIQTNPPKVDNNTLKTAIAFKTDRTEHLTQRML